MRFWILGIFLGIPQFVTAADILSAAFVGPTTRYDHAILGDDVEWGALRLVLQDGRALSITLPDSRVFEDIAPRLADVDGDGSDEVVVVETHVRLGARLSIYDENGLVATTPYIGRTHRWLAPIGVDDFDGDGRVEIAYVDRPHLAKTLRLWRWDGTSALAHVADFAGVTNHQIGWDHIVGGVRNCGNGPEIVLADATWKMAVSVTYDGTFHRRELNVPPTRDGLNAALACDQ
jgi:hypothetical protein